MSSSGVEPANLCFLAGHLYRLAIETADYLCFKLVQYSEMTGNAWGVSKHMAIQYIREQERDLNQSGDKSPYTYRKIKKINVTT